MYRNLSPILFVAVAMACAASANAQTHQHTAPGHNHAMHDHTSPSAQVANGPHGGSLRQTDGIQLETVVSQGGIQMFVYDRAGKPVAVDQGRGAASLRVEGNAKRYRYDLLPDGKGGLTAPVNLSAIAGRQVEIDIQLVGIATTKGRTVSFQEVASVPASEKQLAAAAISNVTVHSITVLAGFATAIVFASKCSSHVDGSSIESGVPIGSNDRMNNSPKCSMPWLMPRNIGMKSTRRTQRLLP